MKSLLLVFCSAILLFACTVSRKTGAANKQLDRLQTMMSGHFNSSAQAAQDTDYFDITLHMHPIWKEREGRWLYVEQAVTANQAKPYRQRVYKLEQVGTDAFVSKVYTLKAAEKYIQAYKTPAVFDALTEADIELKAGCEVNLTLTGKAVFIGKTGDKTCPSELRGASYATSIVTISEGKILSWDQGFNAEGKQVWGAEKGGYAFVKQ